MQVREIMTENPVCCVPDANLEDVARMMSENDCGAIPVVEDQEKWKPLGIVTDRDIVVRAVAEGKNPLDLTADDVMSQGPITVGQDASIEECEREMESHQVRRILVIDAGGGCVGIVSQADIALQRGGQETVDVVGEVSRPASPGT